MINFTFYNSYENANFVSRIISNFDIIYKNGSLIKSNSLEDRQDKPWIKLDRSPEGCVLIPFILKKKRTLLIKGFFASYIIIKLIKKIKRLRYIIPHIENVKPDGVNKLSNKSETSPVVTPPIGRALAR